MRNVLATGFALSTDSRAFLEAWLLNHEGARTQTNEEAAVEAARIAARAAEESAHWTFWAAVASAVGAVASASAVLIPLLTSGRP